MSNLEFITHFKKLETFLYTFAVRLTKNDADAQDLVQETVYKAIKYKNLYLPHTNLRGWLVTIMRNTFINDYRKQKRRQILNDRTSNNYLLDSGEHTATNLGESNVTIEELEKMIGRLEDWARIPFIMHYEGYKYEEIGQELGIPLGTVKSRIFFARKQLKEMIRQAFRTRQIHSLLS